MKLTADQYELIEAYLNDQLAAADRADLELEFQANPELAREVQLQRELRVGFKALGLETRLHAARQRYHTRTTPPQAVETRHRLDSPQPVTRLGWGRNDFRSWAAAASVLLVLGTTVWAIWQRSEGKNIEMAYAENYRPDPSDFTARDLPATLKPTERVTVERGMALYSRGNYAEAIRTLKKVVETDSSLAIANYFIGVSYLTTPNTERAIRYLHRAEGSLQAPVRQKAQWYLALAYLKKNDRLRTQRSLRVVADDAQSPYHQRAETLLRQLFESNP